jgi:2-polyprenyl-3-methyl-5-hydroxy-6-metoxy-1,4-benzoquinol methylase
MMQDPTYRQRLAQEAELWGTVARQQAAERPPDWRYHRTLRQNVIMHTAQIDAVLNRVQPGMSVLELGCGSGWLTLAMAQQGAAATGLDISGDALDIARHYYESIKHDVSGSATYAVTDLNALDLPDEAYDIVVAKGVLHHLVNLDVVIEQIHAALKPGGLFWVSDTNGDEPLPAVLIASGLMMLLPTSISYPEKIRGLARFGVQAPDRIRASIQADGLSPFEGAGREHDWLRLITDRFEIERSIDEPAFTGYITAQVNMPDAVALPLLKGLHSIDSLLVRAGLLRSTHVVLYARKGAVD